MKQDRNYSDILPNPAESEASPSAAAGLGLLAKIRKAGFVVALGDNDKPNIEPLKQLTVKQRELLRDHRESIRLALLAERSPQSQSSLLTPFDSPSFEVLAAWWKTWTPPEQAYELGPGVVVTDPRFSHQYYLDLIVTGCRGQVQLALYDWLKRHAVKFGGPQARVA